MQNLTENQEAAEMVHEKVLNEVNQAIKELAEKYGVLIFASVRKEKEGCTVVTGSGSIQDVLECFIYMKDSIGNLINSTENSEEA